MTVVVSDAPEASRFEVVVDGTLAGFAEYRRDGDVVARDPARWLDLVPADARARLGLEDA